MNRFEISALPVTFATMLYAFEGIGLLLEVRSSVVGAKKFDTVLFLAFVTSTFVYSLFGSLGALAFGDNAHSIIFMSLDNSNKFMLVIEFGYILALILGMPSVLFPATRLIENYKIFRSWIMNEKSGKKSKIKRQMIRLPLAILICFIAAAVPSFSSFLSLLGGFNFVILCFVIPVVFYYIQFKGDPNKRVKLMVNWCIMAVGIILGMIAVVQSIIAMANANGSTSNT